MANVIISNPRMPGIRRTDGLREEMVDQNVQKPDLDQVGHNFMNEVCGSISRVVREKLRGDSDGESDRAEGWRHLQILKPQRYRLFF